MNKKNVLVIGAGTWGTAIANVVADNGHNIFISSIESETIKEINENHTTSKYLPNVNLSKNLNAIGDYKDFIKECEFVFIVVPSFAINQVFNEISQITNIKKDCQFIICSKGIEPKSLKLMTDYFIETNPDKECSILSGPNFAIEVATRLPTITNICSNNEDSAKKIINILNNHYFTAIYDSQPITAEICGVIKNILAIGCGVIDGFELGVNAKAAIITYGTQEIKTLCKFFNCDGRIATAAGFGDLFLTCSSNKSRNNSLGRLLASGQKYNDLISTKKTTYEGASSALSVAKLCKTNNINLPICLAIHDIIYQDLTIEQIKEKLTTTIINYNAK